MNTQSQFKNNSDKDSKMYYNNELNDFAIGINYNETYISTFGSKA